MEKNRVKIFKDTVHGYIEIPSIIVSNLIDTEQFQRLRYIEQTSMRSLYPAARHDRFIHSLGVYYLGKLAFRGFMNNSREVISNIIERKEDNVLLEINEYWWKKQQLLFEIACLMHDCAHAPFSHTLEQFYHLKKDTDGNPKLVKLLQQKCEELGDEEFGEDFYSKTNLEWMGAPHEQLSSYIILNEYIDSIERIFNVLCPDVKLQNKDFVYICRMIIGCKYKEKDAEHSLKNCIISLLNSSTIDVDGLDYIVRDAQMSGISAYNIDYQRILSSFTIIPINNYTNYKTNGFSPVGLWLKDSCFNIESRFNAIISGRIGIKGALLEDSLYVKAGSELSYTDGYAYTKEYNALVEISNAKEGEVRLLSTSRIERGQFSGVIDGRRVLSPEDEICERMSFVLGFDKRCLSVIQNTIDARNNEYLWVYTHPKVLYNSNFLQCKLLDAAADYLCSRLENEMKYEAGSLRGEDVIPHILGYEQLLDKDDVRISDALKKLNYYFWRSNDNDINSLFKRIYLELKDGVIETKNKGEFCELYEDYYGRRQRKLFWKSFMEKTVFSNYCKGIQSEFKGISMFLNSVSKSIRGSNRLYTYIDDRWDEKKLLEKNDFSDVVVICSKAKTKKLDLSEFLVKYKTGYGRLCDVFDYGTLGKDIDKAVEYIFYEGDELNMEQIQNLDNDLSDLYWENK